MGNKTSSSSNTPRSKKPVTYSIPHNAVRPSPPGQPQIEIEDERSVFVQWDPPEDSGGCPIIGYIVQHSELNNDKLWHTPNPPMAETHCWVINLNPGSTYIFRAIAENILGYSSPSQISEPTRLTIEYAPPKFLQELESVNALQHERVEFKARLVPGPPCQMTWFIDGAEVFQGEEPRNVEIRGNALILGMVEADSEIKCLVENEFGAAETVAELRVGVPPRIRDEPNIEHFFRVGEIIRIKFHFTGTPPPTVTWFHNSQPLTQFQVMSTTTILKIAHATRSHQGEYTLRIENTHGQDSTFALVTVADRPSPPTKPSVALMSDNSCMIEWTDGEDDGGCPVTSHAVEYFRSGWDVWLAGTTTRGRSARIRDLIPGSKYIFRVKAENPYGQSDPSESSAQLFIPDLSSGLMTTVDESEEEDTRAPPESSTPKVTPRSNSRSPRPQPHLEVQPPRGSTSPSRSLSNSPRIPARQPEIRSSSAPRPKTPEPSYKPPALLDHYASASASVRSSTFPRNSPNPLDYHYGSGSGSGSGYSLSPNLAPPPAPNRQAAPPSLEVEPTDFANVSPATSSRLSNFSARSQSSLDSARSPSVASSSSHLIFEEDSDGESTGDPSGQAERVTTSSLTLFKSGQTVRIKTASREELTTTTTTPNSREASPLLFAKTVIAATAITTKTKKESSPGPGFKIWKIFGKTHSDQVPEHKNLEPEKAGGDLAASTTAAVAPSRFSKLWDWLWIPLFLALFVKWVNLGTSVLMMFYVFYRLYRIRREPLTTSEDQSRD